MAHLKVGIFSISSYASWPEGTLTNMDSPNDGLKKVDSGFKYGHFWYPC